MKLNLPTSTRIHGANIVPTTFWPDTFVQWPWVDQIKPDIDAVRALGGNCVRLFGCVQATSSGLISLETYLDHWTELVEYCAESNIYVYPCGFAGLFRGGTSLPQIQSVLVPWAEKLEQLNNTYDNIIGIDICNEANHPTYTLTVPETVSVYTAMRQKTLLPMTVSDGGTSIFSSPNTWNIDLSYKAYVDAGVCDYLDFHNYGDSGPSALSTILQQYPDKEIIIGEYGIPRSVGDVARQTRISNSVAIGASHDRVRGDLFWSLRDYFVGSENSYGFIPSVGQYPYKVSINAWWDAISNIVSYSTQETVFLDNFDGNIDIAISERNPDVGVGWTPTDIKLNGSGAVYTGGWSIALISASNFQDVHFTILPSNLYDGEWQGVYLRHNEDNQHGYLCRFRVTGNTNNGVTPIVWEIYRYWGQYSTPSIVADYLISNAPYDIRCTVSGGNVVLYVNGIIKTSFSDVQQIPNGQVCLVNAANSNNHIQRFEIIG